MTNRTYILSVLAAVGLILFFVLRPYIDFTANAPIEVSKTGVEIQTKDLAKKMGISLDSLGMVTTREQHVNYYNYIRDSLVIDDPKYPSELNEDKVPLNTWVTTLATPEEINLNVFTNQAVFNNSGQFRLRYNNIGQVIRIDDNPENSNPSFVAGDSLAMIADNVVQFILGYPLNDYTLSVVDDVDTLSVVEGNETTQTLFVEQSVLGNSVEYVWVKNDGAEGPEVLSLKLKPVIKEFKEKYGVRVAFGASVESFIARNNLEPINLNQDFRASNENAAFAIIFVSIMVLIAVLGFYVGVRAIFKGQVVWGRALFMFLTISIALWGWRGLYFLNTFNEVVTQSGSIIYNINQALFGLAVGLFAAAAYVGWEATSRKVSHKQLPVIDAIWHRKFFMKEIGDGLLKGYLLGGITLGLFCIILFLFEERITQNDSQFGFSEPSNKPKLLTINMSAWSTVWLISLAQVGVVYNFFTQLIKKEWIANTLIVLITGLSLTFVGRLVATTAPIYEDAIIYVVLAIFVVYFYKTYGLLSVSTGWWVFSIMFLITPYIGSSSIDIAYVVWVQAFLIAGPFLYGFIAYKYGDSVAEHDEYIPEYQTRQEEFSRVEKEIEIARESQYNLMPLQPPKGEGFDVHGFFLPSFEVGGDFFDYVLSKNGDGKPDFLTMTVVDVSGKAMRAAMPAVFTSGLLLSRMNADKPSEVLQQVTGPLYHRTDSKTFVTCVLTKLDIKNKTLMTANAGHTYPILKRDGKAEYIETPAPRYPLGIKEEVEYQCALTQLKEGDVIMMYSDGLPEAMDPDGNWFGFETVLTMMEEINTDELNAYDISQEIKRRIQKFSNYNLADDTTIICLKV